MERIKYFKRIMMLMVGVILVVRCKPLEKYAEEWSAVSDRGDEVMMYFDREKKTLTLTGSDVEEEVHEINQNATGIKNSLQYFRIEIEADYYYIIFKDRKDEAHAEFVKQTNHGSEIGRASCRERVACRRGWS